MRVHLINPSEVSFGTAVITPRWLYVLAAATPASFGDPCLVDETLEPVKLDQIQAGDIVGIGIHTANALRGYKIGEIGPRARRLRGVWRHSRHPLSQRGPRTGRRSCGSQGRWRCRLVQGIGGLRQGAPLAIYEGGRIEADSFLPARWDLVPREKYMWASVQTIRGCPKHCSFCSRVAHRRPDVPASVPPDVVIDEIVHLRRMGFRFIALADDNFYPVTLTDLRLAEQQHNVARLERTEDHPGRALSNSWAARQAPERHDFLHPDHHGSGRRRGVPRCHARRPTSKGRSSASRP